MFEYARWSRRIATWMALPLILLCVATQYSFAAVVTVLFDKVKVTARAGIGAQAGMTVFSAQAIADGPFKTKDGAGPIDFLQRAAGTQSFISGFTGAAIFANQTTDLRYFGSVAAPKGSILTNRTDLKWVLDMGVAKTEPATGKPITGFNVQVTQRATDMIKTADGGNAFKKVAPNPIPPAGVASVTFSDGMIAVGDFPAVGNSGEYLWSFISPTGDQPKFPDVMFTRAVIPPDPTGLFKTVKYAGQAIPAPEPESWVLVAVGLLVLGFAARRSRPRSRSRMG